MIAGGTADDSVGYFVRPTVAVGTDPTHEVFRTEYFGPLLALHVYDDSDFETVLTQIDKGSPYGLTGAVIANDRAAVARASRGAAVRRRQLLRQRQADRRGRRPAAVRRRARASGTNDKAGSVLNLLRWVSPRTLKETFVPATSSGYPHQG